MKQKYTKKRKYMKKGGNLPQPPFVNASYTTPLRQPPPITPFTLSELSTPYLDNIRFTQCLRKTLANGITATDCSFNKALMVKEYSTKEIASIIFEGLDESLRKVVEPLPASKQCKKTIGECGNGNTCICWLCGLQIKPPSIMHCDHVLPIIRAIMLTAVKSTNKIEKRTEFNPLKLQNYLHPSYQYAHDKCNIKKSNRLLIEFKNNKFEYDESEGSALAGIIYNTAFGNKGTVDPITWIENKSKEYKSKIERLLAPLNKELNTILSIPGANMETYWRYTIEIIKAYSSEKALQHVKEYAEAHPNENKTKEIATIQKEMDDYKTNALKELAEYRSSIVLSTKLLDFDEPPTPIPPLPPPITKKRHIESVDETNAKKQKRTGGRTKKRHYTNVLK